MSDMQSVFAQASREMQGGQGGSSAPSAPSSNMASVMQQAAQESQPSRQQGASVDDSPSLLSRVGQAGSDLLQGFGEGALQTVAGTGNLIRKGANAVSSGLGDKIVPPVGSASLESIATPDNTTQQVGKTAEDIAEFISGDEALKSLSLGDKLLKVSKVAQEYEKASPFVKTAIEHAMTAARVGTVTGAETTAKTGDVEEGLKAGAVGAVATPVAEGVGALAGKVPGAAKALWNSATGKAIQNELQDGIRSVASGAAEDASAEIPEGTSIRTTFENLSDSIQQQSKDLYGQIDKATDGEFTNLQNKIKNVDFQLKQIAGTDDASEERLFNQKVALNTKMDEAIEQATKNGVDPSVADDASAAWKKQSALADLDNAVKGSTFGNVKNAPEIVDPKKLVSRLQKLDDAGRLSEAIGDDHADSLLQQAYDSAKAANSRATKVAVAKGAVKLAGYGEGLNLLGHALGGSK